MQGATTTKILFFAYLICVKFKLQSCQGRQGLISQCILFDMQPERQVPRKELE